MSQMNVPRQLLTIAIVSVAVAALTATGLSWQLSRTQKVSSELTTTLSDDLNKSYELLESVNSTRDTLQQALRQRDPDELEKTVDALAAGRKATQALIETTGTAGADIKAKFAAVGPVEQQVLNAILQGDLAAGSELFIEKASPSYAQVQDAIQAFQVGVRDHGRADSAAIQASVARTITVFGSGVFVAVTLLALYQWRTRRALVGQLRQIAGALWSASTSVASASDQVASTSQSVSEGVSRQAAALEESSASLEEMSSMTRQNAENAESAKSLASQTRQAAERGDQDMVTLGAAMDEIQEASSGIASIVKSIDAIAFQTNILALNAAVEAARAGEAGMGFAVVADEVRSLAQRAAQAARETSSRIEDSIAKSRRGVEMRDKVTVGLRAIVERVREVDGLVSGIVAASQQQRQGIEQITTGVTEMERVTQSGAAGAEEGAAAAEELKGLAANVQQLVTQLQSMVGIEGAQAGRSAAEAASAESQGRSLRRVA